MYASTRTILAITISSVLLVCASVATAADAPTISAVELASQRAAGKAPTVIDVRMANEFVQGHVPGAINIPFDEIADRISEVEAPNGVALYCMRGPRARLGEAELIKSGYTSVLHLDGGLVAWKAAGFDVEK
jgi:phage shock protein E